MRELAGVFKALSDETRLEIFALLLVGGELCVCDVEGALGITQSKASRHLRYLLGAGLLTNKRAGVWMHYLVPKKVDPARREIIRAARRVVPDEKRAELEGRLSAWLDEKRRRAMTCAAS